MYIFISVISNFSHYALSHTVSRNNYYLTIIFEISIVTPSFAYFCIYLHLSTFQLFGFSNLTCSTFIISQHLENGPPPRQYLLIDFYFYFIDFIDFFNFFIYEAYFPIPLYILTFLFETEQYKYIMCKF